METILFWLCGGLMVLGGVMTVTQRSAVVSAVWLIFAFVCAAGVFAILEAPFVAVMQVLVYVGAIMVLFLFVIMMLQGPVLDDERRRLLKLPLWPAVAVPPAALLALVAGWISREGTRSFAGPVPAGFGQPAAVAELLLGRYVLAFELVSIVLLVAIVGALAIGKEARSLPWK